MVTPTVKSIMCLSLFVLFLGTDAQAQKRIYEDCLSGGAGDVKKVCIGENESCIEEQSCKYIVTLSENRTHFVGEIQTICDGGTDSGTFFGIGVPALSKKHSENMETSELWCTPKFEDFKFVILSANDQTIECESKGETKKKLGDLPKGRLVECPESRALTDLKDFLTDSMFVHSGQVPTERIAENRFVAKKNGIFFTNSEGSSFSSGSTSLSVLHVNICLCTIFSLQFL